MQLPATRSNVPLGGLRCSVVYALSTKPGLAATSGWVTPVGARKQLIARRAPLHPTVRMENEEWSRSNAERWHDGREQH
jgi:hypothetical protein